MSIETLGSQYVCECVLCRRSREINRIASKLDKEDAESLLGIYNSIIDDEEESSMEIFYLKNKKREFDDLQKDIEFEKDS